MKLSVVISTHNRAKSLERTLRSVQELAWEIIVVDNESSDETQDVVKQFHTKVYRKKNNTMLNINKNFGISKASGDWILYLDDDEVIPADLAAEIRSILAKDINKSDEPVGYWIDRKNIIFGKWIQHGIWWPDQQLRLFRKGLGKLLEQHVHEHFVVNGVVGKLIHSYVHYNYDTVAQYLWKMESIYIDSEVSKFIRDGYSLKWWDALRFPISDFVKLYYSQNGYKDGLHGLVLAILQAFYSFLVFVKLWERNNFTNMDIDSVDMENELYRSKKEIFYWMLTKRIEKTHNPFVAFMSKLRRKGLRV